jgi:hypothetical protein
MEIELLLPVRDSGVEAMFRDALCGAWSIKPTPRSATHGQLWKSIIRRTALEGAAFRAADLEPALGQTPVISVDLMSTRTGSAAARIWRFEDDAGLPLFRPFTQTTRYQRPPYVATVRLVEFSTLNPQGAIVLEARVGTRTSYRVLLNKLASTSALLFRQALLRFSHGTVSGATRLSNSPTRATSALGALVAGEIRRRSRRWYERLHRPTWGIGICEQPIDSATAGRLGPVHWLDLQDEAAYFADPFEWPGKSSSILCERYSYTTKLGEIVSAQVQGGRLAWKPFPIAPVLHRSYPYTWREDDAVYMMPEAGASARLSLYRLDAQGQISSAVTVAENIRAADPTLFTGGNLYWIAYTDTDLGLHDNLCLLYSDALAGPWQKHPHNPVKIDISSSRPGGTPFWVDGRLYRPAQDCATTYGGAIAINKIEELSPTRFREITVASLQPDPAGPFPHGLHTLSKYGEFMLVDGKSYRFLGGLLLKKILRPPTTHRGPRK